MNQEDERATTLFVNPHIDWHARFLSPEELAKYLGIPLRWIYRHIKDIPHHRVGKYLRFDLESPALRDWLDSLEQRPRH